MRFILFLIVMNTYVAVSAQVNGVIRNVQSGEVVDGATVFINNSSWQSISDEEGKFMLEGIHPGFFELIVYKNGYDIFQSTIRIQSGKEYRLNLSLIPRSKSKQINVRQDDVWKGNFLRFEKAFLGSDPSDQYRIENAQSLQFEVTGGGLLKAKSSVPLIVENKVLGYTMKVYLLHFESNLTMESQVRAFVNYHLIESGDPDQQSKFEINRLNRYWGSYRHFLQALVSNTTKEDGFLIGNSSNQSIQPSQLVSKGLVEGYYNIDLTDSIKVSYLKQPGHISLFMTNKIIEVNDYGLPLSANTISVNGSMHEPGVVQKLPINYFPSFSIPGRNVFWKQYYSLQEKIYLHTDRDYYYPREAIWFKAYLISGDHSLRDSLSKTVYVDFFSPEMKLIDAKSYPIEDGVAWGDFRLNDSLPAGQYYLRAYTNWMRNFGDSTLFVKAIPVLSHNQNIEWHEKEYGLQLNSLKLETDQTSYQPRQKVVLKIRAVDNQGKPLKAQLSIAVIDGVESVELSHESMTPKSFELSNISHKDNYFDQIHYFMEPGVTIQGIVKDARGNPKEADLEIVEGDNALISMNTNSSGMFVLSGFNSRDSMEIAIMAYSKKGTQVDSVDILPRAIPPLIANISTLPLKYRNADALQRIQNTLQLDDALLLEEVVVKSTTLTKPEPSFQTLNYGSPDHVVKGDLVRFAGPNLLLGLKGRVPGLQVIQANDGIFIRLRGQKSLIGNNEPLILLDGIPLPDANSVMSVDPYSVDRVEVINRAVPIYGSRGVGGMIAIYTKTGFDVDGDRKKYVYKIPGYHKSNAFNSPDYSVKNDSSPDFRTTIFWQPDIVTDENGNATVTFYTADLATRYRIVVEGITEQGKLVRAVSYFTVE